MARGHRQRPKRRDVSTPSLTPSFPLPRLSLIRAFRPLTQVEDRRLYHPLGPARPARSLSGAPHRLIVPKARPQARSRSRLNINSVVHHIGFANPKKVLICIRRKMRREVLLAKGRGGGGHRRPRRSHYSNIVC